MKKIYDSNKILKKIQGREKLEISFDSVGSELSFFVFGKKHVGSGIFLLQVISEDKEVYSKQIRFLSRNTSEIKIPVSLNKKIKNAKVVFSIINHSKIILEKICIFSSESEENEESINFKKQASFLFIAPYSIYGGAEIFIESIVSNISKYDNIKCTVLAHKQNTISSRFDQEDVNIINFYSHESISSNILQKEYDYIIYYNSKSVYEIIKSVSQKTSAKIIEIYHSDFEWPDAISKQKERVSIDLLLKITESVGKEINFPSEILRVPIDTKRFVPKSKSALRAGLGFEDKITIGTVCRLSPEKNLNYFLNIAKSMPQYNFVVVGDGPEKRNLLSRVKIENIKNVRFVGHKKHVEDYLNCFDLFVLTSHIEGTPISMLEAMSCGLSVVVPKVGGIPDIIKNENNFLTKNLSEDVKIILSNLHSNNDFRSYVVEHHSDKKISNNFLKHCFYQTKSYRSIRPWEVVLDGEYI